MNIFFDINKVIYKYENDGTLKKITQENRGECLDGICLITNVSTTSEDRYIYTNVFDYKTKIEIIKKEIRNEMKEFVFSNFIEDKNNFVFALNKKYFLNLMDNYKFKKVYPLEFYLYKIKNGRNGFVSNQILLLKKYENEMDFKINYLNPSGANETLYYINLEPSIYAQYLQRMSNDSIDINLAIFSKEIAETINNFNILTIEDFKRVLKIYDSFYIKDKISNRYKKQVLHRYLYLGDVVLIGLLTVVVFFYLKFSSENLFYESEVETQSTEISKFDKLNKDILGELPKMEFNNFPLKETTEALIPLTNFNPLKTIYNFNIPKNEIMVDMSVSGIDNVESLLKFLNSNNYENSYIKKEGYNFDFKIKVIIDKSKQNNNKKKGK